MASDVQSLFRDFEQAVSDDDADDAVSQQDKRKAILQEVVNTIAASVAPAGVEVGDDQIDSDDMEIIVMPNMCKIMNFYTISSSSCSSETLISVPDDALDDVATGAKK